MKPIPERDGRVARQLLGYVIQDTQRHVAQVEYRYQQLSDRSQWDVVARIGDREYRKSEVKFFHILADILSELPDGSYLVIPHNVLVLHDDVLQIAVLEEQLRAFNDNQEFGGEAGGTVVYQLRLLLGDRKVETALTHRGYAVTDLGVAMEDLRRKLGDDTQIRVCYFCRYLVEYNDVGGTDYRHDQLHCFRDAPNVLNELMLYYPVLREHESLLSQGTSNMDAFHSCPSFLYRGNPRP